MVFSSFSSLIFKTIDADGIHCWTSNCILVSIIVVNVQAVVGHCVGENVVSLAAI